MSVLHVWYKNKAPRRDFSVAPVQDSNSISQFIVRQLNSFDANIYFNIICGFIRCSQEKTLWDCKVCDFTQKS